jgi:hypothetical protein
VDSRFAGEFDKRAGGRPAPRPWLRFAGGQTPAGSGTYLAACSCGNAGSISKRPKDSAKESWETICEVIRVKSYNSVTETGFLDSRPIIEIILLVQAERGNKKEPDGPQYFQVEATLSTGG